MVLRGTKMALDLVSSAAGDIRVYFAFEDSNSELSNQTLQGICGMMAIKSATTTPIIKGAAKTERTITQMTIANVGTALNHLTIEQSDGSAIVPIWERDLLAGEKAVFTDTAGWVLYDTDGVLQGSTQPTDSAIVIKGQKMTLELVTAAAGDMRASVSYDDTNNDMASFKLRNGGSLPPITVAGVSTLVKGANRTNRSVKQLTLANAGAAVNHVTVQVTKGPDTVPLWERDLLAGEKAEFTDKSGWCVYSDGLRQGGGGGAPASTTDATARALAKAANDKVNLIFPPTGGKVPPGNIVSIATTDGGILEYQNPEPTGGADLTIPATPSKANLLTAGFVEQTGGGVSDTVTLANLPADSWTAVPASTVVTSPKDIDVYTSAGERITDSINIRKVSGKFELGSSVAMSNLTIIYEG